MPAPIMRDVANTPTPGRPRNPDGPTFLSRLFGINIKKARHHRDTLRRLSLMRPEGRRYSVKLILQGDRRAV